MDQYYYPYYQLPTEYTYIIKKEEKKAIKPQFNMHDPKLNANNPEQIIYEGKLVQYEYQLDQYNYFTKYPDQYIIKCKQKELRQFHTKIIYPQKSIDEVKKGRSEKKFLSFLKLDGQIFNDLELRSKSSFFAPDITYVSNDYNLFLDIEIDEPYSFSNQPIHFIESHDRFRDQIFTDANWLVVRFSEKQIMTQPLKCCEYINELIKSYFNFNFDNLFRISFSFREKRWTKKESYEMIKRKYRFSYKF